MTANSQQHQAELHKKLWDMANSLRGQMEASEFKNYILGIIFYRFLSEKVEEQAEVFLSNDPGETYESIWKNHKDHHEALKNSFVSNIGYAIKPEYLFSHFITEIETGTFSITSLQEAINELNASTVGSDTQESFDHLFDDLDLTSSKLGKAVADRSALIGRIIQHVNDIPFKFDDVEIDVLGDAYEHLLARYASTAGKTAGEFYTPQQVSRILAKIVAGDKKQLASVYDPTCGSGSLLLRVARETKVLNYYGQELTSSTYNLARMNMLLHGVKPEDFDIKNDNTLTKPQHLGKTFEAIVANPPYSAHWNPSVEAADDVRFSEYGKLAPKTKADFAFVQHMIYHLDDKGTAAVVLPHGVLFRGAAEGVIRKQLIEKNYLDAVIGLPANIFYGTSIPTCILVFKKCREADDKVLFIDASNEYEKGKNSNALRDKDVEKIVDSYVSRKNEEKFSREVELKEIIANDYNLNIPRYVDSSDTEEQIDLSKIREELDEIANAEQKIITELDAMRNLLKEVIPTLRFIKKLYADILETAPTLKTAFMIYDASGLNILLHDGKNVESSLFASYPVQENHLRKVLQDLLTYLRIESYVIRINKDRTAEIAYGANVRTAIWKPFSLTLLGELIDESNYDSDWNMALEGINETISRQKFEW